MHVRRAGHVVARPLSLCGVMRTRERVAQFTAGAQVRSLARCFAYNGQLQRLSHTPIWHQRETPMSKFEYKTVVLNFKVGLFKQGLPDIQSSLNEEGAAGWQLKQTILPSSQWGSSDSVVAILERQVG
jgi:hypothetical protein